MKIKMFLLFLLMRLDTAEGHLKNQRRVIKASESMTIHNNGK